MALTGINALHERHITNASKFWWAYRIAFAFNISPQEVKTWDANEVMEALAAIGLAERNAKKQTPNVKG
jgi:hypothetical protein